MRYIGTPDLGDGKCSLCRACVFWAWDEDMDLVPLVADDTGTYAVSFDPNHIPWCRPLGTDGQLTLDERLYRPHEPECPATRATVTSLAAHRRRSRRHDAPRKRANAR